jgi:hypothetical protein
MKRVDPGQLEGEELRRGYLRTPDEIEAEHDAERLRQYNEFFGRQGEASAPNAQAAAEGSPDRDGRWEEARVALRAPPIVAARPVLPSPSGARVGFPNDTGGISVPAPRGGFFDTYTAADHPALGPAYITGLPRPLNLVTPKLGGWFELGDGCAVWDPRHQLLEAKGPGYADLAKAAPGRPGFTGFTLDAKNQARRQAGVAGDKVVEWHIAEQGAVPYFSDALQPYPSLKLRQTPPR